MGPLLIANRVIANKVTHGKFSLLPDGSAISQA
jgi:hypothetical protein